MSDNTEKIYTHWKAMFKNKFMGPHSLASNCKSIVLTIESVNRGIEKGTDGKDIEGLIINFKEKASYIQPLWCGKHQCEMITNALREKLKTKAVYPELWVGHAVELKVFTEKWFGETDEYLRIHKVVEIENPALSPDMDSWGSAVEAVVNGSWTLEDVTSKRKMLPEHIIQLTVDVEFKRKKIEDKPEDKPEEETK